MKELVEKAMLWSGIFFYSSSGCRKSHVLIWNRFVLQAGARKIEVELTTISSNYHVELNPSDAGFQDRYVVQEIIKEMAKSRPLDISGNKGFKG